MNTTQQLSADGASRPLQQDGSAFDVLLDLIEDPNDNGDYRIPTMRDREVRKLYLATQKDMEDLRRLRSALEDIAGMAERYNYAGWQRIVRRATDALNPTNAELRRDAKLV